jgi:uncharacterized membrane protein YcfT
VPPRSLFAVWLLTVQFASLGQLFAALFSTMEVAQAIVGLLLPLFFLFGGLVSAISRFCCDGRDVVVVVMVGARRR